MKSLAMFNNKGGVGKTTLLCNLCAYLSLKKGLKILIIDADPQCNATQYVFDDEKLDYFYDQTSSFTIYDIVKPLSSGRGYSKELRITKSPRFGFDVLAGDPRLALTEDLLAKDWSASIGGDIRGMRTSLLFVELLRRCQEYDLVVFDVGPSLGSINRAVLLATDHFIAPMSIDIFSVKAIENIGVWLSKWQSQWQNALTMADAQDELEDLIANQIRFAGYVSQQYNAKKDKLGKKRAVNAYDKIMSQFENIVQKNLAANSLPGQNFELGSIPNLNSLIPMSQTNRAPVFDLKSADGIRGAAFTRVKNAEKDIRDIAESVVNRLSLND